MIARSPLPSAGLPSSSATRARFSPAPGVPRLIAAGLLASGLFLSACDGGVLADNYTLSLSEDNQLVVEQQWTLPLGADRADLTFARGEVSPGNVVSSVLTGDDHVVVLTSTYDAEIGQHHLALDLDGVEVSQAELLMQGFGNAERLAAVAADVDGLPTPSVSAAPMSFHYSYASDEHGNQVLVVSYDYHAGGANGRVSQGNADAKQAAPTIRSTQPGTNGTSSWDEQAMEVEFVGYRLLLDEPVPGWSRLRVTGYDELEVGEASFAAADGTPAPSSARRRSVNASATVTTAAALRR